MSEEGEDHHGYHILHSSSLLPSCPLLFEVCGAGYGDALRRQGQEDLHGFEASLDSIANSRTSRVT